MRNEIIKSLLYGIFASILLLVVYFAILSFVSGWKFAQEQFFQFWPFIISLSIGFGIQIGLYAYLKALMRDIHGGGKILGVTGATSTVAMISCCTHYLANILPILGTVGVVTLVSEYQTELFWVGLLFNMGGIFYMVRKVLKIKYQISKIKIEIKKLSYKAL